MHPGGAICNRCRQAIPTTGDSWCTGCAAWEAAGRELAGHWDHTGCRAIAEDLLVNCTRQLRALRNLGAGLVRTVPRPPSVPRATTPSSGHRSRHSADHRDRSTGTSLRVPPPPVAKAEDSDKEESVEEEDTEEEEAPSPAHKPLGDDRRPPEPDKSPPKKTARSTHRSEAGEIRAREKGDRKEHRHRDRDRTRSKKTHRGGRKHQRLQRLERDPFLNVHRKPPDSFWDLSVHAGEGRQLDRSIIWHDGSRTGAACRA